MDEETLEILAGLNAAQPLTQQVDYSGFMQDFQPVLNDPNYFVPQQWLLQDTPVLDTLSDLDVMQQRPPVVMDMLNQYPTLESDFQRSFAVSPDTFNMNVYQPLPYDPAFWESFVNQGGGTTGGGVDLSDLGAAGLAGVAATSLLSSDDGTTGGTDAVTTTIDDGDDGDGGGTDTLDGGTSVITIGGNTVTTNIGGTDTVDGGSSTITLSGTENNTDTTLDGSQGTEITLSGTDTLDGGDGNDTIDNTDSTITLSGVDTLDGGAGNDTIDNTDNTISLSGNTGLTNIINSIDTTNSTTAINDINTLVNSNVLSNDATSLLTSLLDNGVPIKTAVGQVVQVTSGNLTDVYRSNVINPLTLDTDFGLNIGTEIPTGEDAIKNILGLDDNALGAYDAYGFDATGFSRDFKIVDVVENGVKVGEKVVRKNFFDKQIDKFGNLLSTELPYSIGSLDTVGETIPLVGGILSGLDAIEDGNIANVSSALGGLSASGLLGGTATTTAGVPLAAGGSGITTTAGTGLQGLATNPVTLGLLTALTIAQQLAPDPSNKTGFSGFDLGTSTTESFGMEGDKFKQSNVDKATKISEGIGTAINTIASGYGLKTEGDILTQTGNRDPLSITFGDQESEQTINNRLNYSPETGDIINSNDDVSRFYYTGQFGNDGNAASDNVIRGTNLLSLKALANDEDTINMKDFRVPIRSSEKAKEKILEQMTIDGVSGIDETTASLLTEAARSGNSATYELLGGTGLLVANTTNEDLFLTDEEVTSLLDKGIFENEEQIDEVLYG